MLAPKRCENVEFDEVEKREIVGSTRLSLNERRRPTASASLGRVRISVCPILEGARRNVQVPRGVEERIRGNLSPLAASAVMPQACQPGRRLKVGVVRRAGGRSFIAATTSGILSPATRSGASSVVIQSSAGRDAR